MWITNYTTKRRLSAAFFLEGCDGLLCRSRRGVRVASRLCTLLRTRACSRPCAGTGTGTSTSTLLDTFRKLHVHIDSARCRRITGRGTCHTWPYEEAEENDAEKYDDGDSPTSCTGIITFISTRSDDGVCHKEFGLASLANAVRIARGHEAKVNYKKGVSLPRRLLSWTQQGLLFPLRTHNCNNRAPENRIRLRVARDIMQDSLWCETMADGTDGCRPRDKTLDQLVRDIPRVE